ncbi:MAG: hypothetical protein BACD_04323 [Bacteroides rodentium]
MTDRFILYDGESGTELLERSMVEHIHSYLVENGMLSGKNEGRKYHIVSQESGYSLEVDKNTSQRDFREYSDKCLMTLD